MAPGVGLIPFPAGLKGAKYKQLIKDTATYQIHGENLGNIAKEYGQMATSLGQLDQAAKQAFSGGGG